MSEEKEKDIGCDHVNCDHDKENAFEYTLVIINI
jgi:hypothetical protein